MKTENKEKLEKFQKTIEAAIVLGTVTKEEGDMYYEKKKADIEREEENLARILKRQKESPDFFYHGI